MLSSAKKSVPTPKQFVQPYFIEIAPDGAIMAVCPRFSNLLQKNSLPGHLEKKVTDVFLQLGDLDSKFDPADLFRTTLPISFDLSVNKPGIRPFIIRWTPTPADDPAAGGWQLTGVGIDNMADHSLLDTTEKREMENRLLKQELSRQKRIAQAMVDAQEKERAEIGKELHDSTNQILSTTKLYLELAKNDQKERLNLIARSAENIDEAIHEIRNISRSLAPSSIYDLGLIDSIYDLIDHVRNTGAIHVEFHPVGSFDEKVSDREKLMLFRIVQEQVNNVLKHSAASNLIIKLVLEEWENRIELTITDDGKGFHPEKVKNGKGRGLSNIVSRADLFGGEATLNSAPGQGCTLRIRVPVK
jgi:signal transduction histidine kinase